MCIAADWCSYNKTCKASMHIRIAADSCISNALDHTELANICIAAYASSQQSHAHMQHAQPFPRSQTPYSHRFEENSNDVYCGFQSSVHQHASCATNHEHNTRYIDTCIYAGCRAVHVSSDAYTDICIYVHTLIHVMPHVGTKRA